MKEALSLATLLFLVGVSALARADGMSHPVDDVARAEELFRLGTVAFEAERYSEAFASLRSAWDLAPGYRTAAGLGQVELHLGQYRDAAEHLSYCLVHFPSDGDREARSHVEMGLAQAREHVAALRVEVSVDGSEVAVDGAPVGRTPLAGLVFVAPGPHRVVASHAGYASATESVDGSLRITRDVSLSLIAVHVDQDARPPLPSTAPVAPRRTEDAPGGSGSGISPSTWALVVGGSLTAAFLVTGLVFDANGASADRKLRDLRGQIPGGSNACAPGGSMPEACSRLGDTSDGRDTDYTIATVAAVGTGVVAAATLGVALLLQPERRGAGSTGLRALAGPSVTSRGGGVVIHGAF